MVKLTGNALNICCSTYHEGGRRSWDQSLLAAYGPALPIPDQKQKITIIAPEALNWNNILIMKYYL